MAGCLRCSAPWLYDCPIPYRSVRKDQINNQNLRICSSLAWVYRVMDARGKFGEHEKCVRVARGAAESNSSFLSALQTSQVHPQLDIRTARSMSKFIYNRVTTRICAKKPFIAIETKILTTHKKK